MRIRSRSENLSADEKYFRLGKIVESKSAAARISVKTNRGFHDPGFQVRLSSASQVPRVHGRGSGDARFGDRRQLGDFRANQWRSAALADPVAAKRSSQRLQRPPEREPRLPAILSSGVSRAARQ